MSNEDIDKTVPGRKAQDMPSLVLEKTIPGRDGHIPFSTGSEGPTVPGRRDCPREGRFEIGDVIMNRYRVLAELGHGGMGVVYKCFDQIADIEIALKSVPYELSHDSFEMEDVKRNFQLVHNLRHPNIAGLNTLELDNSNGIYYLIMECVDGEDLRYWLRHKRNKGSLTPDQVLPILRQVARALDYAHGERIIHRDIKPGNIMVDAHGRVKVLDFGLADKIHTSMTKVSAVYHSASGTGPYMAPEQWRGCSQDAAADQYALAVMAYEMLAGHVPFEGKETDVLRGVVLNEMPRPLEQLSEFMNTALLKALAKDPKDRFGSCCAFVDAMEGKQVPSPANISGKPVVKESITVKPSDMDREIYRLKVQLKHKRERIEQANPDRGQTFDFRIQDFEENFEAGIMALDEKNTSVAFVFLTDASKTADWILKNIPVRKKVTALLKDAREQQRKIVEDDLLKCDVDNVLYQNGKDALSAGESAFENGDFSNAKQQLDEASSLFKNIQAIIAEKRKAEAERIAKEKAEAKRIAKEKAEAERIAKEKAEAERIAREEVEAQLKVLIYKQEQIKQKNLDSGQIFDSKIQDFEQKLAAGIMALDEKNMPMARSCLMDASNVVDWILDNISIRKKVADLLKDAKEQQGKIVEYDLLKYGIDKALFQNGKDALSTGESAFENGDLSNAKQQLNNALSLFRKNQKAIAEKKKAEDECVMKEKAIADLIAREKAEAEQIVLDALEKKKQAEGQEIIARKLVEHFISEDGPFAGDLEMIEVLPGTFTMAHKDGENDRDEIEHQVTLTKAYWLGKTPVTQGQWETIMGYNPSSHKKFLCFGTLENYPVENVSWNEVQEFLKKLNEKYARKLPAGYRFDLPTEAQWEYAAQGGHKRQKYTKYAGSDNLDEVGWHDGNSGEKTHPVAQKNANELGLYDMSGNVLEWCKDCCDKHRYTGVRTDTYIDGVEDPLCTEGSSRVLRGGSCLNLFEGRCRCAFRRVGDPSRRDDYIGFRLTLVPVLMDREIFDRKNDNLMKDMIRVEPGTFTMAHKDGENDRDEIEHQVTLTRAYWLGKTPVTQGQWKAVLGNNPSNFKNGDDYPVENVSWNDIQDFLIELNKKYAGKLPNGYGFDLPTEAQWEYAAQGGHKRQKYTRYAGSDTPDEVGWHDGNSGGKTHPVAQKNANELGLYDMSGNVWEWCSDRYGKYGGDTKDSAGAADGSSRVLRGGSYYRGAKFCRIACRSFDTQRANYINFGFRLALVPILTDREIFDLTNNDLMKNMIRVEPGTFTMAYKDGENDRDEIEHQVKLTKAYWLGKTPVTQGQWKAVMGNNPSKFKNGNDYPVENFSWNDVQVFLKKLNEMYEDKLPMGYKFDLPTEAQWEYAAQGGHKRKKYTKYAGSDNLDEVGWYGDNAGDETHSVGRKKANELGLYDMSGNVWEWCSDWYGEYGGDAVDPKGSKTGSFRVLRGGSWGSYAGRCWCASRSCYDPSNRDRHNGVRLALVPVR